MKEGWKPRGIRFGRKRSINRETVLQLKESGTGATAIARQMHIGRSTVYKILKEEKAHAA
jgi:DNA invertase Pin-like site-specific DNA recombinase